MTFTRRELAVPSVALLMHVWSRVAGFKLIWGCGGVDPASIAMRWWTWSENKHQSVSDSENINL